ncbi:MAG: DUF488 family protein [Thermodesulfovibrionales bacterium]
MAMKIYTIGYTRKGAKEFFGILKKHNIQQVVDIRENNTSQLTGFTKRDDLRFFVSEILNASYIHLTELAPDREIREAYKRDKDWQEYEKRFLMLMKERHIPEKFKDSNVFMAPFVLLCSEHSPDNCHRRLVAELLKKELYPYAEIIHL